jgi:hypothetical protein
LRPKSTAFPFEHSIAADPWPAITIWILAVQKNQAGSFPDEPASEAMTVNKKKCVSSSNNKKCKCKQDKHGNEDCEEDD